MENQTQLPRLAPSPATAVEPGPSPGVVVALMNAAKGNVSAMNGAFLAIAILGVICGALLLSEVQHKEILIGILLLIICVITMTFLVKGGKTESSITTDFDVEKFFLEPHIWLTLSPDSVAVLRTVGGMVDSNAEVVLSRRASEKFLSLADTKTLRWSELLAALNEEQKTWIKSFEEIIRTFLKKQRFPEMLLPLFIPHDGGFAHRAFVPRCDRLPDGSYRFTVVFIPIPAPFDPSVRERREALFHLLVVTKYFQWRIIDKLYLHAGRFTANEDRLLFIDRVLEAINETTRQATLRGLLHRQQAESLFLSDVGVKHAIARALDEWEEVHPVLGDCKGKVDKWDTFIEVLGKISRLNSLFLSAIAHEIAAVYPYHPPENAIGAEDRATSMTQDIAHLD